MKRLIALVFLMSSFLSAAEPKPSAKLTVSVAPPPVKKSLPPGYFKPKLAFKNPFQRLYTAAICNDAPAIHAAVAAGASIHARYTNEMTPLMWAAATSAPAHAGSKSAVELLLEKGANPADQCSGGYNALMHAVLRDNVDAIRLLAPRSNLMHKDKTGVTVFTLAEHYKKSEAKKILYAIAEQKIKEEDRAHKAREHAEISAADFVPVDKVDVCTKDEEDSFVIVDKVAKTT